MFWGPLPRPTVRRIGALALPAVIVAGGCVERPWPDPPAIEEAQFHAEQQTWRAGREGLLRDSAHSFTHWVELHPLAEGGTPLGTDSALAVVLPSHAAVGLAGVVIRAGREILFEPAGDRVRLHDGRVATGPVALHSDSLRTPTCLRFGPVHVWVHDELGRLFIRVADEAAPALAGFRMPEPYPLDARWRVAARMEQFREPRVRQLLDVTGELQEWLAPGYLLFRFEGGPHRLLAYQEPGDSTTLRLMFRDPTNAEESYGAGRYLSVPVPDSLGWTVVDFNRSRNPPCAFTPASVCALPPRENRLPFAVSAGERRFENPPNTRRYPDE